MTQKGGTDHNKSEGGTTAWPVYSPDVTPGTTQPPKETNVHQAISGKVRILLYGGARLKRDNSAFYFASLNVKADYERLFPKDVIIRKFTDSAKEIVDKVKEQKKGSIASLDLFSHGSKWGLYFYKGASINTDLTKDDITDKNLNAGLYGGRITGLSSTDDHAERRLISDINFDRFAKGAVIELHGCESGGDLILIDSITRNLSEAMPEGYVIGHTTKADPLINGPDTTNEEQDYRFKERAIWQNGKVLAKTKKRKHINISDHIK